MIDELEARFVEVVAGSRSALAAAMADPWVAGSSGQLRPHPGYEVAGKLDLVVVRLAAEIRMARRQASTKRARDDLDELAARRTRERHGRC